MKRWRETAQILERFGQLAEAGRPAALATVVEIQGSAYRRPGAKLLVEDDGTMTGSVSGGCLEQDVREVALEVMRGGLPRLRHYETDDTAPWGLGLGCGGKVRVFLRPLVSPDPGADALRALLRGEEPFALSTVISESPPGGCTLVIDAGGIRAGSTGDSDLDRAIAARAEELLAEGVSKCEELGSTAVFTEVLSPPPRLLICGAGEDAVPLAACCASVGFRVTVADHRSAFLTDSRFPEAWQLALGRPDEQGEAVPLGASTHAVVMTHSYELDREWLSLLVDSEVPYIGVLGPRARTEKLLAEIETSVDERVFGPVGLDLGAEGPEQIALSIAAELLSFWSGRKAQPLRKRDRAIHDG